MCVCVCVAHNNNNNNATNNTSKGGVVVCVVGVRGRRRLCTLPGVFVAADEAQSRS